MFYRFIRRIGSMYYVSRERILAEMIEKAVDKVLDEFSNMGRVDTSLFQRYFDRQLTSSSTVNWLPTNDKGYSDRVYLDFPSEGWRRDLPDSRGILDYTTMSLGSNIGFTMHTCAESDPETKKRGKFWSRIMHDNLVFAGYNRRRTSAASFNSTLELEYGEQPWVKSPSYKDKLSGIHLITAVLAWKNHKEAVVVSREAAENIVSFYPTQQKIDIECNVDKFAMTVKVGDIVENGSPLVIADEEVYRAKKLKDKAKLREVRPAVIMKGGKPHLRIIFRFAVPHKLSHGDKLCNRHGFKGTVELVDADEMPMFGEERVQALISPLAVAHRRQLGHYVEMLANEKVLDTWPDEEMTLEEHIALTHPTYEHFQEGLIHELMKEGYGRAVDTTFQGVDIRLYAGRIYWMTLDKIAKFNFSIVSGDRPAASDGNWVDKGSISGVKLGLPELMLLEEQGLGALASRLIETNRRNEAVVKLNQLMMAYYHK